MKLVRGGRGKTAVPAAGVAVICPSCGDSSEGRFCSACGEEKGRPKNHSLLVHLRETFNVVTNIESGFIRSFTALITRPGFLTSQYFAGRRKPFLKPLQLFLFCNVIFFFGQSYTQFNTLSTPLSTHMRLLPYSNYARAKVDQAVQDRGITLKEYQARFNATIGTQSKTLVVLMIPMFALVLQALYWRAGRYFVEHLVFSIHFYSFYLLLLVATFLLTTLALTLARRITTNLAIFQSDLLFTAIPMLCCLIYLLYALRRVYEQGWILTVAKCVILLAGIMCILQLYRFCLFFIAFYSV